MAKDKLIVCEADKTRICDLIDSSPYSARNIQETFKANEITSLTFDVPVVSGGKWANIVNEKLVFYHDEYYIIKKPSFYHDEDEKLYLSVECKHLSDILANSVVSIEEVTPMNIIDLMKLALLYDASGVSHTGWTIGQVNVDKVAKRGLEAVEESSFSILLTIAEKYDAIMIFDSVNMQVHVYPTSDTERPDIDLRVSKNLKSVEISYDTSEMCTRLYCYGGEDDNGNELDIMDVNPTGKPYIDNFEYFKKIGYTDEFIKQHQMYFTRTNIWRDSAYFDAQDLYDDGVKQLAKVAVPIVDIKVSALDTTAFNNSNTLTNLKIGDCIRVYDEDLGLDTLCNVISRTINHEEPHILNIEVTNSITYHDTLSKLFTSVNTLSVVGTGTSSGGGGSSGGDWEGNISVDDIYDLHLYYLTAEQIEATYASIGYLQANYITANEIRTNYLDAVSIAAQYATIGSLEALEAKIGELDVEYINGKFAEFEKLFADNAEFHKLVATEAEIEELKAGTLTVTGLLKAANAEIGDLKATTITTGEFNAYKATIEQLFALYATIEHLEANYIKAQEIEAKYAKITDLDVVNGTIDNLKVSVAQVETLVANKADIEDLNAVKADIETINAKLITVDEVLANVVTTDELNAEIAKINKLISDEIEAVNATITSLDAKFATIEKLNAEVATINNLIAQKASIEDLEAAKADIGELDAMVGNIETILSGSIGTGTLQTVHLTAKNVVIDDAVIKSANIESIDVDKLNAGIISTDKFQVQSNDGGFKVIGNTTQWTDAIGKVRMQAGRDQQGNFNFAIFGVDGTTAIFNENGVQKGGIASDVIVDDMVAPDAGIQAKKINYVTTEGNQTLQTIIDIQQGSIDALIKDTTIGEDKLKDKFLELSTTVDGLNITVGNVESGLGEINSKVSSLELTTEGLTTKVTEAGTNAENALTIANQAADKFSWLVKSGDSETNFELTDRTAQLVADNINLKGLVTFSGLNSETQEKINTGEQANTIVQQWASDAVDGETFINGGYIQTHTITTAHLDVDEILAQDGTFLGIIKAQDIDANRITSGEINADLLNIYGLVVKQKETDIETFSIDYEGDVTLRGSVESYNYISGESGWSIKSSGDAEFNDVVVRGSLITNNAGILKINDTLSQNDLETIYSDTKEYSFESVNAYSRPVSFEITNIPRSKKCYFSVVVECDEPCSLMFETEQGFAPLTQSGNVYSCEHTFPANASETYRFYITAAEAINSPVVFKNILLQKEADVVQIKHPVIWAGASYEQREYAPFIVYSDGTVKAQQGSYSGVWTGDIQVGNISIVDPSNTNGGDAIFTIKDGNNGVRKVELTDSDNSYFSQNISIRDDFYNEMIKLSKDGLIQTLGSFVSSNSNSFTRVTPNGIELNNATITGEDNSVHIKTSNVYIDNGSSGGDLNVSGSVNVANKVSVAKELNFGDNVSCVVTSRGIDFSFNVSVTVTFNSGGGSEVQSQSVRVGGYAIRPVDPTRVGYSFGGWYKDLEYQDPFMFDEDIILEDTTLYAKWYALPSTPTVAVQQYKVGAYEDNQGRKCVQPCVVSASVEDGGTLTYTWRLRVEDAFGNIMNDNIYLDKTDNTLTIEEVDAYIATPFASTSDYRTIIGTCTVINTINGVMASTVVEIIET